MANQRRLPRIAIFLRRDYRRVNMRRPKSDCLGEPFVIRKTLRKIGRLTDVKRKPTFFLQEGENVDSTHMIPSLVLVEDVKREGVSAPGWPVTFAHMFLGLVLPNTRDDRRRATDSAQPNGA